VAKRGDAFFMLLCALTKQGTRHLAIARTLTGAEPALATALAVAANPRRR
jgi:hypothetical protein